MITVYITTWQVPFAHVVTAVKQFNTEAEAVTFINQQAAKWWAENDGDRCVAEGLNDGHTLPETDTLLNGLLTTLLWGGESGFVPMVDSDTYAQLHQHQGKPLPGYLINAYAAGHKPGGCTETERAEYEAQARDGLAAVLAYYIWPV